MHRNLDMTLLRYTTGTMSSAERARFETHLSTCSRCQMALAEWRALAEGVRETAQTHAASLPPLDFSRFGLNPRLRSQGEANMVYSTVLRPVRSLPRAYSLLVAALSLSLVAALGALLLRGAAPNGGFPTGSAIALVPESTEAAATPLPEGTQFVIPTADVPQGYDVVVVAVVNIPSGTVIRRDQVLMVALPERFIDKSPDKPSVTATSLDQTAGRIARTNLYCGQIISSAMLTGNARNIQRWMPTPGGPSCETHPELTGIARDANAVILTEPVETIQVVTAAYPAVSGMVIDEANLELRDYPAALVPSGALIGTSDVHRHLLDADLFWDMVVVADMLQGTVPDGTTAITIPHDRLPLYMDDLNVGDQVGVGGSRIATDGLPGHQTPVQALDYVQHLQVVWTSQLGVSVAGSPGDIARVQAMIDALTDIGIKKETNVAARLPEGTVAIAIPRAQLSAAQTLEDGQIADLMTTLAYIDVPTLQAGSSDSSTPADSLDYSMHRIITGVLVVDSNPQSVTLAVSPQDAVTLTWLIEAGAPLWLEPSA